MSFPRKIEIFVKSLAFYSKLKFWPIEGAFKNVFWPPIGQRRCTLIDLEILAKIFGGKACGAI